MQLTAEQSGIVIQRDAIEMFTDLHIEAEINRTICEPHPHKQIIKEGEAA